MEKAIWGDQFIVGIKEIDDQHEHFIRLLNKAYKSFYNPAGSYNLAELIGQIYSSAAEHFATEEKHFAEFKYDKTEEHQAEHQQLLADILQFRERLITEGGAIIVDLVDFLEKWLTEHTLNHDRQYIDYFREHGISWQF